MTVRLATCLAGLSALAACHSPGAPSPPPGGAIGPLTLSCPADIQVQDVMTSTQAVTYDLPGHDGGLAPISEICSPASGAAFPLGATTVSCTGTDAATPPRTAACTFKVTLAPYVPPVPVLSVTRFLAVGDSLTAGENGIPEYELDDPRYQQDGPCVPMPVGPSTQFIDFANSYPSSLATLLAQRYATQSFTVVNCGKRGQTTFQGNQLLGTELSAWDPQVVMLFEGYNDLLSAPDDVITYLRADIETVRARGKKPYLSTLVPLKLGSLVGGALLGAVAPMNNRIRALAVEQSVPLVDSAAAFQAVGDYSSLLADDGLHCKPEGYRLIAQTFMTRFQATLEVPASSAAASRLLLLRPQVQVGPQPQGKSIGIRKIQ